MPCSRQRRSKICPIQVAVGPSRYWGRSANAMPLSVSTVWIAYGNTAITSRRKAAPFILVAASKNATWVNLLTRSMARKINGQKHVELAFRQAQLAGVDVHVADLCLGKALALGGLLLGFGQPRDAVPNQAAVKGAAGQRRDARAQAAQNIIKRQQGAAPELNDNGLLGLGQNRAARPAGPHRLVGGGGALTPLGDGL